jgi:hypothetical protein
MASDVPFNEADELLLGQRLSPARQPMTHVPNEPFIPMENASAVHEFLDRELSCKLLDNLYPYLYFVARKSNEHIEPLHRHIIKARNLAVSEQPSLHLVWNRHNIYLKPVPHCLFSYQFWERHLALQGPHAATQPQTLGNRQAALGLLRSYSRLIQHESDFVLAKEAHLLPPEPTYCQFKHFIHNFSSIPNSDVAVRYQYGQFRLTRLNFTLRCLKLYQLVFWTPKAHEFPWSYEYKITDSGQTGSIISWLAAPFIGVFAFLSLVLTSMQVVLVAQASEVSVLVCRRFAIAVIVALLALWFIFFTVLCALFSAQFHYGWAQKVREKEQHPVVIPVDHVLPRDGAQAPRVHPWREPVGPRAQGAQDLSTSLEHLEPP